MRYRKREREREREREMCMVGVACTVQYTSRLTRNVQCTHTHTIIANNRRQILPSCLGFSLSHSLPLHKCTAVPNVEPCCCS